MALVTTNLSIIVPKGRVPKPGEKSEPPIFLEILPDACVWQAKRVAS